MSTTNNFRYKIDIQAIDDKKKEFVYSNINNKILELRRDSYIILQNIYSLRNLKNIDFTIIDNQYEYKDKIEQIYLKTIEIENQIKSFCGSVNDLKVFFESLVSDVDNQAQLLIQNITQLINTCLEYTKIYEELSKGVKEQYDDALLRIKFSRQPQEETTLNVTGVWKSNWGEMIFNQDDEGNVISYYPYSTPGVIIGKMKGNTLVARWYQEPTYKPPKDEGSVFIDFKEDEFKGKYGYGNSSELFNWEGKKVSDSFDGNCVRYKLVNASKDLPNLYVNDIYLKENEETEYIYPDTCAETITLNIRVGEESLTKVLPVKPAHSYTIYIIGNPSNIQVRQEKDPPTL